MTVNEFLNLYGERIVLAFEDIAAELKKLNEVPPAPPPEDEDDWTEQYDDPLFAPTTETEWVIVTRDHRTRVFTGKYNDAGNPIIRLITGVGTKLLKDQKVLVYAKKFQGDGSGFWELCDPANQFMKDDDAKRIE